MGSHFDRGGRADNAPGTFGPVPTDFRGTGLTYEPFYGLREKPFSLTSDARFFYQSRSHAPAFDDLLNAIKRRESLNVLTGDIGTGKTTLCRAVLQSLDRKTFSAFVPDPFASRQDLLKVLLTDFGVASLDDLTSGRLREASRTELSYLLYEFLRTLPALQAFAVVFIDEAQNLSLPLLEEIRILSDADGQLQVVLVGQLELREKLKLPEMRQLEQRVSVHCQLQPLDLAGVAGYISHRLHRAGGSADRVSFTGDAVEVIYEQSGGVPRLINKLCDRALHVGHSRRAAVIGHEIVAAANDGTVAPPPGVPAMGALDAPLEFPSETEPHETEGPAAEPLAVDQERPAPDPSATPARDLEDPGQPKELAGKPHVPPEPGLWRERWTPNDLISEPARESGAKVRIRIANGKQIRHDGNAPRRVLAPASATPGPDEQRWTERPAALAVCLVLLVLAVIGGSSVWDVADGIKARFDPPAMGSAPQGPPLPQPPGLQVPRPLDPLSPDPPPVIPRASIPANGGRDASTTSSVR
jgi:type II secretory pathway predicted ATPase ExeA